MPGRITRLFFMGISIAAAGTASAAAPTIYPLGISSGSTRSRGYSVNAAGRVAVTSVQLFGQGTAARYDGAAPGGTLLTLTPFAGYAQAFANSINASGQVAGHAQVSSVTPPALRQTALMVHCNCFIPSPCTQGEG